MTLSSLSPWTQRQNVVLERKLESKQKQPNWRLKSSILYCHSQLHGQVFRLSSLTNNLKLTLLFAKSLNTFFFFFFFFLISFSWWCYFILNTLPYCLSPFVCVKICVKNWVRIRTKVVEVWVGVLLLLKQSLCYIWSIFWQQKFKACFGRSTLYCSTLLHFTSNTVVQNLAMDPDFRVCPLPQLR